MASEGCGGRWQRGQTYRNHSVFTMKPVLGSEIEHSAAEVRWDAVADERFDYYLQYLNTFGSENE